MRGAIWSEIIYMISKLNEGAVGVRFEITSMISDQNNCTTRSSITTLFHQFYQQFVLVIAWFVVVFIINTTSDISKLLYIISWAVRRVKFETIWNITSGIYAKYHVQFMLLFVYTTLRKSLVIFTCRYFKLSRNTTALSQSNCRHFSCSSIRFVTLNKIWKRFGCAVLMFLFHWLGKRRDLEQKMVWFV